MEMWVLIVYLTTGQVNMTVMPDEAACKVALAWETGQGNPAECIEIPVIETRGWEFIIPEPQEPCRE